MTTTISLSPVELKNLIQSAVNEAIEKRFSTLVDEINDEQVIDRNLARLVNEERLRDQPTLAGEQFLAELKAAL